MIGHNFVDDTSIKVKGRARMKILIHFEGRTEDFDSFTAKKGDYWNAKSKRQLVSLTKPLRQGIIRYTVETA